MKGERFWRKLEYFIASMKRKFPDLDPDSVEAVIEQVIVKIAPSKDRNKITRESVVALRAAIERRMSRASSSDDSAGFDNRVT